MYILRFEKNRMFSTQIYIFNNRLARFARSQSCIHFLQFPTRRHSIRPYYHEHKWTLVNQHKDLLYRQKYATYQLNNHTFSTQNTKKFQLHMFSGTYCKKRGKKPYYHLLRKIWWPPHKGSIREIATGEITLSITPDDHLEGPYLLKTRELPGAPPPGPPAGALPLHPARGPTAGPWTPPVWGARWRARGALRARIFPPTPFLQILDPPLYTSPLARPSRLPPEASILGELGQSPPLPMKILGGGGGKHIVLHPPPPNNFVNLKNW